MTMLDNGIRGVNAKIKFRRALPYYALVHLGLDTDSCIRKPQDQQFFLLKLNVTGIRNE